MLHNRDMAASIYRLESVEQDNPIAHLIRRKVVGEQMLWAYVNLEKGCHVASHQHESEQIAYVMSGKVLWRLGEVHTPEYSEEVAEGGTVIVLPSNFPHGVDALEDTVILDVLAPPGLMGVDRQGTEANTTGR